MGSLDAEWELLTPAWRAAISAAWESWRVGSAGVGAVLADTAGTVVAVGRNRMAEREAGRLSGTMMAHAEMDVLSQVPFGTRITGPLYTTFEPCMMCAATILFYRVPELHYAAADPVFDGLHDWIGTYPFNADRVPRRHHLGGPFGAFCHVLHLSWLASYPAPDAVLDAHRRLSPEHLACARRVASEGHLEQLARDNCPVSRGIEAIWDELLALSEAEVRPSRASRGNGLDLDTV